jgi:hypothetical protein
VTVRPSFGRRLARALLAVALLPLASVALGATAPPPAAADRTWGDDPLDAILAAADAHNTCGLTRDKLAALMLAPTVRESGAPATEAPSPMTLSRWDTQSRLYSFANPSSYSRAFWHPGISPWQWDDASLQGHTASQRINTTYIANFTAEFIQERWCTNPTFAYVWTPWFGCADNACRTVYNEIFQDGHLTNIDRDSLVGLLGGMERHTCSENGGAPFTCWFIDPARAQGHDGWASPGAGPAPISDPFYSFARDGYEKRHWLREHTGYSIDIQGSLQLGKDSRTSLTWASGSTLCDLTLSIGRCDAPPTGFTSTPRAVSGSYWPIPGDFNGDGRDDVLWYGIGAAKDALWYGTASKSFTSAAVNVSGTYWPIPGDFDGNGRTDVLWYGGGSNPDSIWYGSPSGFTAGSVNVSGVYTPVVGDFTGNGSDDILWYGPGPAKDAMWLGSSSGFDYATASVNGTYTAVPGDFDADGAGDILWYGSGTKPDSLWMGEGGGSTGFEPRVMTVNGVYDPVEGDFSGDGRTDVLWYGRGSAGDSLWYAVGDAGFSSAAATVSGTYAPFSGDFDGANGDDVYLYGPGAGYDVIWYAS